MLGIIFLAQLIPVMPEIITTTTTITATTTTTTASTSTSTTSTTTTTGRSSTKRYVPPPSSKGKGGGRHLTLRLLFRHLLAVQPEEALVRFPRIGAGASLRRSFKPGYKRRKYQLTDQPNRRGRGRARGEGGKGLGAFTRFVAVFLSVSRNICCTNENTHMTLCIEEGSPPRPPQSPPLPLKTTAVHSMSTPTLPTTTSTPTLCGGAWCSIYSGTKHGQ